MLSCLTYFEGFSFVICDFAVSDRSEGGRKRRLEILGKVFLERSLLLFESSSAPISNQNNLIAAELNLHFREKRLLAAPLVLEFLFSEMHQERKLKVLICQKLRLGPQLDCFFLCSFYQLFGGSRAPA